MLKLISLMFILIMFSGCSYATVRLMYSDAKVVYEDAHFVVHEIQDIKEGK